MLIASGYVDVNIMGGSEHTVKNTGALLDGKTVVRKLV